MQTSLFAPFLVSIFFESAKFENKTVFAALNRKLERTVGQWDGMGEKELER